MKGFWANPPTALPNGRQAFFVLAPMADVTDAAFRHIIAKYGKPDVTWTEFVSADGLALAPETGRQKLLRDLLFSEAERPIVAQFFTSVPAHMEKAAALVQELGFDGVDINMGCPDKSIEKQGAGAKLITTPDLAVELIQAAKKGAPRLPVSVKTRLGYNKDVLEEWLPKILSAQPVAVTIHARTRKEMSAVPARWERVKRAVEIRNELGSKTLILGNGDLKDLEDAKQKVAETGADGAMLGRAIFGNPWLFQNLRAPSQKPDSPQRGEFSAKNSPTSGADAPACISDESVSASVATRLRVAVEHSKMFESMLGDVKNFALMKKHFKAYVEGFPGAKELRMQLMETTNAQEIEEIIEAFLKR